MRQPVRSKDLRDDVPINTLKENVLEPTTAFDWLEPGLSLDWRWEAPITFDGLAVVLRTSNSINFAVLRLIGWKIVSVFSPLRAE